MKIEYDFFFYKILMNSSLYFVSSERQSFWNKNLKSLVNYDFHKLSED